MLLSNLSEKINDGSTENSVATNGSTVPEPSVSKAFEDLNRVMKRPKLKKKNKKKKILTPEQPKLEIVEPVQEPSPVSPRVRKIALFFNSRLFV